MVPGVAAQPHIDGPATVVEDLDKAELAEAGEGAVAVGPPP